MRRGARNRQEARGTVVVALAVVALAACGGGGGSGPTATAGPTTTTVTTRPSALVGLRNYLTLVDRTDTRLAQAARLVNGDMVASGMRIRPATRAAIRAVELDGVARALPAGMSSELTRRALLVYSELASRRGAFAAVLAATPGKDGIATVVKGSGEMEQIMACLANGSRAHARFAADVSALRKLAESSAPFTVPPASSRSAGEILVRTSYIDGWNRCCDSCGGYVTDRLAPVVWRSEELPYGGHVDGNIDGVDFEASYRAGSGWLITIHAG